MHSVQLHEFYVIINATYHRDEGGEGLSRKKEKERRKEEGGRVRAANRWYDAHKSVRSLLIPNIGGIVPDNWALLRYLLNQNNPNQRVSLTKNEPTYLTKLKTRRK